MNNKINIATSELPIMKVLWEKDNQTSPEIFANIEGNISTLKTLLKRLVDKGAIKVDEINSRTYCYSAIISKNDYIKSEQKGFLNRVFDGSKEKMLLSFVSEENITKDDLQQLMDMIKD